MKWERPRFVPSLGENVVHVWLFKLEGQFSQWQRLRALLSEDELIRAERFYFERDRHRFVFARGNLRVILGRYVKQNPASLNFIYNDFGKPFLTAEPNQPSVNFNLSHSDMWGVLAVTLQKEVGIDIEKIKDSIKIEEIAERFFAPGEIAQIRALEPRERIDAFFNCWTRKEAFIKAVGKGLSLPLHDFEVTVQSDQPVRLLKYRGKEEELSDWFLTSFDPLPGFKAALAVHHDGAQEIEIRFFSNSNLKF